MQGTILLPHHPLAPLWLVGEEPALEQKRQGQWELPPAPILREGEDPLPRRVDPPEESLTQSQFTTQLQEPTDGNGRGTEFHVDRLE